MSAAVIGRDRQQQDVFRIIKIRMGGVSNCVSRQHRDRNHKTKVCIRNVM